MMPARRCPTPGCTRRLLPTTGLCAVCSANACRPELPESDGSLNFAEAMALDPSEVEFLPHASQQWQPFEPLIAVVSVIEARRGKFRRSRPKRSRVQEMARSYDKPTLTFDQVSAVGEYFIRAVCEYLRGPAWVDDGIDLRKADQVAGAIEREFLEPR